MLRHRQGVGRQEGARSTRGVFAGDSFQPWLSQSRRGLAGSVEGHVVGEGGFPGGFGISALALEPGSWRTGHHVEGDEREEG